MRGTEPCFAISLQGIYENDPSVSVESENKKTHRSWRKVGIKFSSSNWFLYSVSGPGSQLVIYNESIEVEDVAMSYSFTAAAPPRRIDCIIICIVLFLLNLRGLVWGRVLYVNWKNNHSSDSLLLFPSQNNWANSQWEHRYAMSSLTSNKYELCGCKRKQRRNRVHEHVLSPVAMVGAGTHYTHSHS